MAGEIVSHSVSQSKSEPKLPTISEVLADPCVHFRVKDWLREALNADCVDAYYDALLVAELLKRRMNQELGRRP